MDPLSSAAAVLQRSIRRLPTASPGAASSNLWTAAVAAAGAGLVLWLIGLAGGMLVPGVWAMWAFAVAAAVVAIVLPWELAVVSPLFMGLFGWLVDLQPLTTLAGGSVVAARYAVSLVLQRRVPSGGRIVWLPIFLVAWAMVGVVAVDRSNLERFVLLLGLQFVASALILAVVDRCRELEARTTIAKGLVTFLIVSTAGVGLQYAGVPMESLQHEEVADRVHEGYGIETWATDIGMIRYVLASQKGLGQTRRRLRQVADENATLPNFDVFLPKLGAFQNYLVVRFEGSARDFETTLSGIDVELIYDNVGLAPARTVPRWRSFARNSLTYAGISVAIFPLALFFAWNGPRRKWLGWAGAACALIGAGFSLARGAWLAIAIGVVYAFVDAPLALRRKIAMGLSVVAAAVVLTAIFLSLYGLDPINARSQGGASVGARASTYEDTIESLRGYHLITGFGTEEARRGRGVDRYIPPAGTHSTYLSYLFRTGVPGAIAIVTLYALAWLHARASAWLRTGRERAFSAMTAVSMTSLGAHAAILSLFVEPIYTITISLIVGCALAGGRALPGRVLAARPRPG